MTTAHQREELPIQREAHNTRHQSTKYVQKSKNRSDPLHWEWSRSDRTGGEQTLYTTDFQCTISPPPNVMGWYYPLTEHVTTNTDKRTCDGEERQKVCETAYRAGGIGSPNEITVLDIESD